MKGSDYTQKILELTNALTQEQNAHNETAAQLKRTTQELIGARLMIRAYDLARVRIINRHEELLPAWDAELSQALFELRANPHSEN